MADTGIEKIKMPHLIPYTKFTEQRQRLAAMEEALQLFADPESWMEGEVWDGGGDPVMLAKQALGASAKS